MFRVLGPITKRWPEARRNPIHDRPVTVNARCAFQAGIPGPSHLSGSRVSRRKKMLPRSTPTSYVVWPLVQSLRVGTLTENEATVADADAKPPKDSVNNRNRLINAIGCSPKSGREGKGKASAILLHRPTAGGRAAAFPGPAVGGGE